MMLLRLILFVLSMISIAAAQQSALQPAQPKNETSPAAQPAREDDPLADGMPVVSHHQVSVGGESLKYAATAGRLLIKPESGATEAAIFFTAYTLDGEDARTRPLTFVFNGGPGTATAWLHMGALGPRKIKLEPDGGVPAPPYVTVDNPETILDRTDLVFIDAPGTGYSRVRPDLTKKFYNVMGDADAFYRFIRLYLSRYQRWRSPMFLFGESYARGRSGEPPRGQLHPGQRRGSALRRAGFHHVDARQHE